MARRETIAIPPGVSREDAERALARLAEDARGVEIRRVRGIRFSDSEWARVSALAQHEEQSTSEYVRQRALAGN